jgi:hypothetical protein
MDDSDLIKNVSTEVLEAELKRRREEKPPVKSDIDWNPVRNVVLHITHTVDTGGAPPKDFENMLFEASLRAVYGEDIFPWWNNKLKNQ